MEPNLLFGHYRLLHYMKRAQRNPNDYVAADLFNIALYTAHIPECEQRYVVLGKRWNYELESALDSLEEKGCIESIHEENDDPVYCIKYDSRRIIQTIISKAVRFLITSVAVPIAVSAVTAFVTVLITSALQA